MYRKNSFDSEFRTQHLLELFLELEWRPLLLRLEQVSIGRVIGT